MSSVSRENIRTSILRIAERNNTRFGLGSRAIQTFLPEFGIHGEPLDAIEDDIDYLISKGLMKEVPKQINAENRVWRITPAGIQFLDERGLL